MTNLGFNLRASSRVAFARDVNARRDSQSELVVASTLIG